MSGFSHPVKSKLNFWGVNNDEDIERRVNTKYFLNKGHRQELVERILNDFLN